MISTSKRAPRYLEVASALEAEISNLSPNGLLLTEKQLAERYDVSRVTIRGALDLLEKSGLISRMRGRGTIVSPPKVTRRFAPLFSFEQDLDSQGIAFTTRILAYERKAVPPPSVRERLELPSRSSVGCLTLVRIVFDRVVCHERRHYPPQIAARIDADAIANQGASKVLEQLMQAADRRGRLGERDQVARRRCRRGVGRRSSNPGPREQLYVAPGERDAGRGRNGFVSRRPLQVPLRTQLQPRTIEVEPRTCRRKARRPV